MNYLKTLKFNPNDEIDFIAEKVKSEINENKVLHISTQIKQDESKLRNVFDNITNYLGASLDIAEDYKTGNKTGNKWMEIRYDHDIPDMDAYRHSKNAQPLHTDESYMSNSSEIMVMYCVKKAPRGGETVFINSDSLIKILKEKNIELFNKVISHDIRFSKSTNQRIEKIIDLSGTDIKLNWNYYCVAKDESSISKKIADDFHSFLQEHIVNSAYISSVDLEEGDGVFWWDNMVLHGRNSFEAHKTNDRFLWKSGIKIN
jgi:alpha-ketoglutarate-dependent taurine dioxygenase